MNLLFSKKYIYLMAALFFIFIISVVLIWSDIQIQETIEIAQNFDEALVIVEEIADEETIEISEEYEILLDQADEKSVNTYIKANIYNTMDSEKNVSPIIGERYIVNRGDTLYLIARRTNLSLEELKAINNLKHEDIIYEGQVLKTKLDTSLNMENNTSNNNNREEDDIYWLSRIIHAEAQGEPYEGKVAVGNVVLNRVAHKDFPNTIYGVIYDRQYGYIQFSPVLDGSINNMPNEESRRAAIDALNGVRPVGEALYFLNPRKATNFWIVSNRVFYMTIGEHDFYF